MKDENNDETRMRNDEGYLLGASLSQALPSKVKADLHAVHEPFLVVSLTL